MAGIRLLANKHNWASCLGEAKANSQRAQVAKIAGLEEQVEELTDVIDTAINTLSQRSSRLQELKNDAERYRYLRDNAHLDHFAGEEYDDEVSPPATAIDNAIDTMRHNND
jgi:hypothetical protein